MLYFDLTVSLTPLVFSFLISVRPLFRYLGTVVLSVCRACQMPKCYRVPASHLTLWRLTTTIVVVPHRWPLNFAFYIFIQQIKVVNILNMVHTLRFFSSKCSLFHKSNIFVSCIIHILYTGCAKIEKNNSGAKRLNCICLRLCFSYTFHFCSVFL